MKITKKQLLAAGASENCAAYKKFVQEFGDEVEIDWTPEKQLEMLADSVWRRALGWCWWEGILPAWSMFRAALFGANLRDVTSDEYTVWQRDSSQIRWISGVAKWQGIRFIT